MSVLHADIDIPTIASLAMCWKKLHALLHRSPYGTFSRAFRVRPVGRRGEEEIQLISPYGVTAMFTAASIQM